MIYKELPAVVQAKMLELQRAQQGRAKASVFERKLDSCKMEGGIDWPKEQFEAWSDALREGKTEKLEKLLSKGKRGRKAKGETPERIKKELAKRAAARGAEEELRLKRESEQVNHPEHYNATSTEVLVMMEAVWGKEAVRQFCEMHAFKYRMRAGYKGEAATDIEKALWYERRAKCL